MCLTNLGDGVLLSPCISALFEELPHIKWVLVAKPSVCELYGHDNRISEFIPFTCSWFPGLSGIHDGWSGFFRTVRSLRKLHCKTALNTASDVRTNLLARLAGINRLISAYARHGDWLSSEMVAPELVHVSEAERQLELAARLLGKQPVSRPLDIRLSDEDDRAAALMLRETDINNGLNAVIHPGANVFFKEWPLDWFADVGRFLISEKKCSVLVLGARGREEGLAADLVGRLGRGAYDFAGKTPVRTLLALLKRCILYVGNDSGPTHLAAAAACPTVAIFGATNPFRFGPYLEGDLKRIVVSPQFNFDAVDSARERGEEMLKAVTVDMVIKAVNELWAIVAKRHVSIEAG